MRDANYLFPPPPVPSLPIRGSDARFPVRRIFCVGRNYLAHALEMGSTVDKATMRPFYFMKDAGSIVESGATVPYPSGTQNYQHELELVVAIGQRGRAIGDSGGQMLGEHRIDLDRHHLVDDIEQRQGQRAEAGADLEHGVGAAHPGGGDDPAHGIAVVHEVLSELLGRAYAEPLGQRPHLGGPEQCGLAAR